MPSVRLGGRYGVVWDLDWNHALRDSRRLTFPGSKSGVCTMPFKLWLQIGRVCPVDPSQAPVSEHGLQRWSLNPLDLNCSPQTVAVLHRCVQGCSWTAISVLSNSPPHVPIASFAF